MRVQRRQCSTCIYKVSSPLDLNKFEGEIRDPKMHGFFIGFRACHHADDTVCCRGFWNKHRNHFQLGQISQRLGLVEFVSVDLLEERDERPED